MKNKTKFNKKLYAENFKKFSMIIVTLSIKRSHECILNYDR